MTVTRHGGRHHSAPSLRAVFALEPGRLRELLQMLEATGGLRRHPGGGLSRAAVRRPGTALVPRRPPSRPEVIAARLHQYRKELAAQATPPEGAIALPMSFPPFPSYVPGPDEIARRYGLATAQSGSIVDARA